MNKVTLLGLIILLALVAGIVVIKKGSLFNNIAMNRQEIVKKEVYIDVRTDQEWEEGHLDDAMHFDVEKIKQGQIPDLAKDTPILLYCRTGRRAEEAKNILLASGFTNVSNIGGLEELDQSTKIICYGKEPSCY